MKHRFKNSLIAGLLLWLPILVTVWLISFIVQTLDDSILLLPRSWQPEHWLGLSIPGLGVIFSIAIVLLTGAVATNYFGAKLVAFAESLLDRIPLVRSVYIAVKQLLIPLFAEDSDAFSRVLLVPFPRPGLWSIALQTGKVKGLNAIETDEELLAIFVPTTPNPSASYINIIPSSQVIPLDISIDEALKMIISTGVVQPGRHQPLPEAKTKN